MSSGEATATRFVCIHGHFYQPPRENPWLEAVERQQSAWPARDWNHRVTDECYGPNAYARILDEEGRIVAITNNYARLSYNVGPTLLGWMEAERPEVHAAIIEADRESAARFGGHGSAIAQVFNHMIMPLASPRDRRTQVQWGLRDFERHFGRAPEGMWLAETAVDTASLEALAEAGIAYTILAPHQCGRVRRPDGEWVDVSGQRVDPKRPYRVRLPSGKSIAAFFYDGPISRAVAFERLLDDGHRFAERLLGAFDERSEPQLLHIATDGETYGHHHSYGEMALAVALDRFEAEPGVELVNYGQFLELFPPTWEASIVEDTSWSCVHGVERWRADCGCNSGTGWHQRWRAPLREALDDLASSLEEPYARVASEVLKDPWVARDAYIDVVLDRSEPTVDAFFTAHGREGLDEAGRARALQLLELQRHAMLMYTSCGWFFDEPSGLETIQVLRYAARAMQLASTLFGTSHEAEFCKKLETAPSNKKEYGDVAGIYRAFVEPSRISLPDVGAHFAIGTVLEDAPSLALAAYDGELIEHDLARTGASRLATGRLRVRSRITHESSDFTFAVLHLSDHNLLGGIRSFRHPAHHVGMHGALSHAFGRADLTEVVRQIHRHFEGSTFSLRSLFHDQQTAIVERLLSDRTSAVDETLEEVYDQIAPLMRFLQSLGEAPPEVFRASAQYTIRIRLRRALGAGEAVDLARVGRLLDEAREASIVLDPVILGQALESTLGALLQSVRTRPEDVDLADKLAGLAEFVAESPWKMDLGAAQNALWRHLRAHAPAWQARCEPDDSRRLEALRRAAEHLRIRPTF